MDVISVVVRRRNTAKQVNCVIDRQLMCRYLIVELSFQCSMLKLCTVQRGGHKLHVVFKYAWVVIFFCRFSTCKHVYVVLNCWCRLDHTTCGCLASAICVNLLRKFLALQWCSSWHCQCKYTLSSWVVTWTSHVYTRTSFVTL